MNLVIDIGNSRTKYAIYKDEQELHSNFTLDFDNQKLNEVLLEFNEINKCIVSGSGHIKEELITLLKSKIEHCIQFTHKTPLPFNSKYKTPETIGLDRLAACAGALSETENCNRLIVDLGTAITYEFLSADNEYLGGNISPGMQMRFRALHEFTNKLPLEEPDIYIKNLGKTTSEALIAGVVNGIIYEIEGTISNFKNNYEDLTVLVTGGDSQFFEYKLKKTIFVVQNLVSKGLNTILNYNVKNH